MQRIPGRYVDVKRYRVLYQMLNRSQIEERKPLFWIVIDKDIQIAVRAMIPARAGTVNIHRCGAPAQNCGGSGSQKRDGNRSFHPGTIPVQPNDYQPTHSTCVRPALV